MEREPADRLRVAAIQVLGQAQNGPQRADDPPLLPSELAEAGVFALRRRLPVIPRHERDHVDLLRFEPAQIAVANQVVRVLMVILVADVDADVVQHRRVLEPFALAIGQAVDAAGLIEQREREARDLIRVFREELAALGQLEHAAAAHVRIAIGLRDLLAVPRDVVEHEPFAQRQVAQRDLVGAEAADDVVEENRAGDDEVGAPRFEAGNPQPLVEVQPRQIFAQPVQLLRRDAPIPQRRDDASPIGKRHGAKAEDGARRSDDAIESGARDLIERLADLIADVAHELPLVARLDRIGFDESLAQADDAELEAAPGFNGRAASAGHLDAAAADVDHDRDVARETNAVNGGRMDQPRFLGSRDEPRADARMPLDGVEELAAILRLAHGARRNGDNFFYAMRFGQTPEFRQHLERCMHRLRRERLAVKATGTEPDHLLLPIDHLEGEVGPYLHHYHVDRVGSDVDRSDAHVSNIIRVSAEPEVNKVMAASSRARLIRTHVDRFVRALQGVERGEAKSVHRARVATRRLREIVPVLQLDGPTAHKLSRKLRTATTRLGAVREHDVLLQLVDELHDARRASGDALARVGMAVSRDRDAARERLLARMPVDDMRRLARKLRTAAEDIDAHDAQASRVVRWALDARVTRRASRLAGALRDAGSVYLPERLHAARIAIKKLRYVLDVAGEILGAPAQEDIALLRRAQDALGRMHDLQVLIDRVRAVQATLAPPSITVWRALDTLVRVLDDDCRRLHARYMRLRPELESMAERQSGSHPARTQRAG